MNSVNRFSLKIKYSLWLFCLMAMLASAGCSLWHKVFSGDDHDEEVSEAQVVPQTSGAGSSSHEETTSTATPLAITPPATHAHPALDQAAATYEKALQFYDAQDYKNASERLKDFIEDFPGMPGYQKAHFYLGSSLSHLGRYDEAVTPLRNFIEGARKSSDGVEAQLVLIDVLAQQKKLDEALAANFEVLPDRTVQKRLGVQVPRLAPGKPRFAPRLTQQIRIYIIRAQVLTAMDRTDEAELSLKKAKRLLEDAPEYGLTEKETKPLKAEQSWREIEMRKLQCGHITVPEKMAEAEFMEYANKYYDCAVVAKESYCEVTRSAAPAMVASARDAYKALVHRPLQLKEHLPPSSRPFKDEASRQNFEVEMKALIDKTVSAQAEDFRHLDECGIKQVW